MENILLIILSGCSYKPIHVNNKYGFSIDSCASCTNTKV